MSETLKNPGQDRMTRRDALEFLILRFPAAIKAAEAAAVTAAVAAIEACNIPDTGPHKYSVKQLVDRLQTPAELYPVITHGELTDGQHVQIPLRTSTGAGNSHYFQDIPTVVSLYRLHDQGDPIIQIGVIQEPEYRDFKQIPQAIFSSGEYRIAGELQEILVADGYTPINPLLVHNIGETGVSYPNEPQYEWVIDITSVTPIPVPTTSS